MARTQKCNKCGEIKRLAEFGQSQCYSEFQERKIYYIEKRCKQCVAKQAKEYRDRHKRTTKYEWQSYPIRPDKLPMVLFYAKQIEKYGKIMRWKPYKQLREAI